MAIASFAVVFALVVASVGAASQDEYLDQELSGYVTTFKIPSSGVWQSFRPSYNGSLSSLHVLVGATKPTLVCIPYRGQLSIFEGKGSKEIKGPLFTSQTPLIQQTVVSTHCRCSSVDCVTWQEWTLDTPLSVSADSEYSFHLSSHADPTVSFRVALMVVDGYTRGENNFEAQGYDYAFKTYMQEANPDGSVTIDEDKLDQSVDKPKGSINNVNRGTNPTMIIIVALATVLCVIVIVVFAVRRYQHRQKKWLSTEEAIDSWRLKFNGAESTGASVGSDKLHSRSRLYVLGDRSAGSDTSLDRNMNIARDNWVLAEAKRSDSVRSEDSASLHWRGRQQFALPDMELDSLADASVLDEDDFTFDNPTFTGSLDTGAADVFSDVEESSTL